MSAGRWIGQKKYSWGSSEEPMPRRTGQQGDEDQPGGDVTDPRNQLRQVLRLRAGAASSSLSDGELSIAAKTRRLAVSAVAAFFFLVLVLVGRELAGDLAEVRGVADLRHNHLAGTVHDLRAAVEVAGCSRSRPGHSGVRSVRLLASCEPRAIRRSSAALVAVQLGSRLDQAAAVGRNRRRRFPVRPHRRPSGFFQADGVCRRASFAAAPRRAAPSLWARSAVTEFAVAACIR